MKNPKRMAFLLLSAVLMSSTAFANTTKKTKKVSEDSSGKPKLGTSFHFDGSSLHGKFQTSPSTTATVENDKYLDDLLGAPKNFDDRIARDGERN